MATGTREKALRMWRWAVWQAVAAAVRVGARLSGYPEDVYRTYFTERKLRDETGGMRFSVLDADPRTRPYDATGERPWLTRDGLAAARVARMQRSILLEQRRRTERRKAHECEQVTPWERIAKQFCSAWMAVAESRARKAVRAREVMQRLAKLEHELQTMRSETRGK